MNTQHTALLSVRPYNPEDYSTLSTWWASRGGFVPPAEILPEGWILDRDGAPVVAVFAYLAGGIGVAHLEWLVSKTGLAITESRALFAILYQGVREVLRAMDYTVVFVHSSPAISREVKKVGMTVCSTGNVFLMASTTQPPSIL